MANFSEILDAASGLSADEQETLLDILGRRLAERRRAQLIREVNEAESEYASGRARPATVDEIMDEADRDT